MTYPLADVFGYGSTTGAPLTATNPTMQSLIDRGIISQSSRDYSNEGGQGTLTENKIDWSQLPNVAPPGGDRYGNWISAGPDPYDLINSSAVYDNPYYGRVTPSGNFKVNQTNGYDMIGPIFASALTAGVGAPWFLGAGLAAAKAGGSYELSKNDGYAAQDVVAPELAQVHWSEILGGMGDTTTKSAGTSAAPVTGGLPSEYNPGLYGNLGSLAAPPDGSAPVATGIAPDAYINSSPNQVVS